MALPALTPEQRADALAKAALARKARAEALDRIRKGTLTIADIVADKDSPLQRARVRQVLLAVPGIGAVTADRILADHGISPTRRVGGLGKRQVVSLIGPLAASRLAVV